MPPRFPFPDPVHLSFLMPPDPLITSPHHLGRVAQEGRVGVGGALLRTASHRFARKRPATRCIGKPQITLLHLSSTSMAYRYFFGETFECTRLEQERAGPNRD